MRHTSQLFRSFGLRTTQRFALALAGGVAGLALCCGVLSMFAVALSQPWLPGSAEAVAQAEQCRQKPQRQAREACVRQLVAQWQAAEERRALLASRR